MVDNQGNDNTAVLKGKLSYLRKQQIKLAENIHVQKAEFQILRSEKETLESVLTLKMQETHTTLQQEIHRVSTQIKQHTAMLGPENERLQQIVNGLQLDKQAIQKEITRMTARIENLEQELGN